MFNVYSAHPGFMTWNSKSEQGIWNTKYKMCSMEPSSKNEQKASTVGTLELQVAQHCNRNIVFFNVCDSIWNIFVHDVQLLPLTTGQVLYVYWINIVSGQIFLSNIQTHLA